MTNAGRTLVRAVQHGTDWTKHVPNNPFTQRLATGAFEEFLATPSWSVRSLLPPSLGGRGEGGQDDTSTTTPTNTAGTTDPGSSSSFSQAQDGTLSISRHRTRSRIRNKPNLEHKPPPPPPPPPQQQQQQQQQGGNLDEEITIPKLHHLLRLSSLPLPKTQAQESRLLETLRSQVHFVRHLQAVDTTDVEPLVVIRDETNQAREETKIGLADLEPWLRLEESVGRNGTVRRRRKMMMKMMKGGADEGREKDEVEAEGKDREEAQQEEEEQIFKGLRFSNAARTNLRQRMEDLKADRVPPSGNEEGRRWGRYYVVKKGKKNKKEEEVVVSAGTDGAVR